MSEIKRVVTPMANTMMVLDQGEEVLRSPSGLSRRPLKKATSEGLISLSSEPGNVKFEVGNQKWLESEGTRCSSAGRIERKLQLFKKKEDTEEQRRNSTDGLFYGPQPDNPLVTKLSAMKISNTTSTAKTKLLQDEKPSKTAKPESESSESEGETDESESDDEETKGSDTSNEENKVMAPIEVKAEFLQCVMSGNYEKAQEICKQILLLEPDNSTCKEFHSVIVMKIEQENMQASDDESDDDDDDDYDDSDDDDDEGDDEEDDDDDDNDEEADSDSSSSSKESEEDTDDEDFTVAPGLNLLMGGLPIKPQSK